MAKLDPFVIQWPPKWMADNEIRPVIEYLNIFLHDIFLRTGGGDDLIDGSDQSVTSVFGLVSRLNSLTSEAEKKLEDIEQLTVSLNSGFSRLDELNKRLDDLEQSSSDTGNLSGKVNSKVSGQDSSTDNAIVRFNGKSGKIIQDSEITIDDDGNLTLPNGSWTDLGININSSDTYKIDGTVVLNATTLGNTVLSSSLTSVGFLENLDCDTAIKVNGTQVVGARTVNIPNPTAGVTIDANARTAIDQIIASLELHGLSAP